MNWITVPELAVTTDIVHNELAVRISIMMVVVLGNAFAEDKRRLFAEHFFENGFKLRSSETLIQVSQIAWTESRLVGMPDEADPVAIPLNADVGAVNLLGRIHKYILFIEDCHPRLCVNRFIYQPVGGTLTTEWCRNFSIIMCHN